MKKLLILSFTLITLLLSTSCKTNLDTILENYDSNFKRLPVDYGPYPGDDDFDESLMLENEYFVYEDGTFVLSGPQKALSYKWVVIDVDDKERTPIDVITSNGSSLNTQTLIAYIPNSGLQVGKTYQITLTVTDTGGKAYSDRCGLTVYRHYNY